MTPFSANESARISIITWVIILKAYIISVSQGNQLVDSWNSEIYIFSLVFCQRNSYVYFFASSDLSVYYSLHLLRNRWNNSSITFINRFTASNHLQHDDTECGLHIWSESINSRNTFSQRQRRTKYNINPTRYSRKQLQLSKRVDRKRPSGQQRD